MTINVKSEVKQASAKICYGSQCTDECEKCVKNKKVLNVQYKMLHYKYFK